MGEIQKTALMSNAKIAMKIQQKFGFTSEPQDGGISNALFEFIKDHEPRNEFIILEKLMFKLCKFYRTKEGKAFLKKIKGFENFDEAILRFNRLKMLFGVLIDWKVDAYLNFLRLKRNGVELKPEEKVAISHLYIDDNGNNEKGIDLKRREIVIIADTAKQWLEDEKEADLPF